MIFYNENYLLVVAMDINRFQSFSHEGTEGILYITCSIDRDKIFIDKLSNVL
jgi:hypothetical protein